MTTTTLPLAAARPRWRRAVRSLRRHPMLYVGAAILLALAVIAVAAPWLTSIDPQDINPLARMKPPSAEHFFGTDALGRDVYARTLWGAQVSLLVGVVVALVSTAGGVLLGMLAGYFRRLDAVIMRIMDGLMAIPGVLLAIALMATLKGGLATVIVAIVVPEVPRVVRLVRALVLTIREQPYIEAAVAAGTRVPAILLRHILPNLFAPLMVQATFIAASAILTEAVLSFLGVGIPPHIPSWATSWPKAATSSRWRSTSSSTRACSWAWPCWPSTWWATGCATCSIRAWRKSCRSARMPSQPVLQVNDLTTCFEGDDTTVLAVDGLSFDLMPGETLGLVGESGCGKSVTSLSIMRLLRAPGRVARGRVEFDGRDLLALPEKTMRAVRGNQLSMIFQEPMTSLNPVFTIGRQISEPLMLHQGLSRREAMKQAEALLELVQISDPARRVHEYPYQLSGGMRQRAMIAMALACQPKVLIADEPTTALDVTIQAQILHLLRDIQARLGTAIVLITHDLGVVAQMCQRVIVMYAGRKVEEGSVDDVLDRAAHPYTQALIRSLPDFVDGQDHGARLAELPGIVPVVTPESRGCAFAARCPEALPRCAEEAPPEVASGDRHRVWCWARQPAPAAKKEQDPR
ncbi:Glutathione import ATP-binding protein GsiA [Achromobacter xylosoxidans]|jgi:peptide/nickel transport system ATP-binding protein|nr:Glutathione import ATP-binding protein GsiA [Achromobacter xylosoxidans]